MNRACRTTRQASTCRCGYSLLEMLVSLSAATVLMTGMASAIYLAGQSFQDGDGADVQSVDASDAVGQIVRDVQTSNFVLDLQPTSITLLVPDRDGDGAPEKIRYSWNGTPGDGLLMEYNDGPAAQIAADVQSLNFTVLSRLMTAPPLTIPPPSGSGSNLLFVVIDPGNLTSQEQARKDLVESWGYSVTTIAASDTQQNYDTAVEANDVAYISEEINSSDLGTKLKGVSIGVVNGEIELTDEFGFSSDKTWPNESDISIVDNTHYITSEFAIGLLTISSSSQSMTSVAGTLASGLQILGGYSKAPALVCLPPGGDLYGGGTAAGRRVQLPWGGGDFDINLLTDDGRTLLQRAIEWAAGADTTNLGLIAHWKLDETSGTTAADSSGNNHHGTLSGDPTWTPGTEDGALDFDGSGDYVTTDNDFTPPPAGTVSFWMQVPGSPGSHGRILGLHDQWEIRHVTTGTADGIPYGLVFDLGLSGVNAEFATTTTIDTPGKWYHIAASYDTNDDTYAVYVDGVPHKSGTYPSTLSVPAAAQLSLGTRTGSTNYFTGLLDDVRIYDRVLAPSEVEQLAGDVVPDASCDIDPNGTYIEAENFTSVISGSNAFVEETTTAGYNGVSYLRANGGNTTSPPNNEGRNYEVNFTETGTYYVWIRGYGLDGSTDSVFLGLNGAELAAMTPNGIYNQWVWSDVPRPGGTNQLNIVSTGTHTINFWVREPDFKFDGFYITKGSEIPTGGIPSGATELDPSNCIGGSGCQSSSVLEVQVVQSSDDAEEDVSGGAMNLTSSDLELISDGGDQVVGIRFQNITIPQGAQISEAYIDFTVDELNSGATSVSIRGQAADNAATFTTSNSNISSRANTTAVVAWSNIPSWDSVGAVHTTPDLVAVVQEIVNRPGWSSGNAMAFIVTGSGERTAESYNGEAAKSPKLRIIYCD